MRELTPERQFAQLLATDGSKPFVTYYDEATGERSELSVRSLGNWVAKTHHLLGDELGLGVGQRALIALPAHWISVPVLIGCLTAGLALVDGDGAEADGDADVAFVSDETISDADGMLDVYAIAPARAAVGFGDDVPGGAQDYVASVRPQADAWGGVSMPAAPPDPCLPGLTRADVVSHAAARATELGLEAGGRLLTTRAWDTAADWLDAVLVPLAVGGSIVLVRNTADPVVLDRRASQERVTARLS